MKYIVLCAVLIIMGCSNPYEDCIAKKQESWRKQNPKANYGKASTENERFRSECSILNR